MPRCSCDGRAGRAAVACAGSKLRAIRKGILEDPNVLRDAQWCAAFAAYLTDAYQVPTCLPACLRTYASSSCISSCTYRTLLEPSHLLSLILMCVPPCLYAPHS